MTVSTTGAVLLGKAALSAICIYIYIYIHMYICMYIYICRCSRARLPRRP